MRAPLLAAAALLALCACSQPVATTKTEAVTTTPAAPAAAKVDPNQPAGTYYLDPSHSTVVFKVSHIGMSNYTAQFGKVAGTLQLDPAKPAAAVATINIDPTSLVLPAPPEGFRETLLGPQWLDAERCREITFRSTAVKPTGADTADITGDLTLHCVTHPVTLKARFNGGYPPGDMDPYGARIGFSATGALKRSDFGVSYGIPAPGSTMGVGDALQVAIEAEFTSRAEPAPMPAAPQPAT